MEKRQAFLNEILDQGLRKFSEYAEEIKPDPYVRLGAALQDIAQGGLSIVNSVFGPLLEFLAESKGVLTAVFGVLVFSLIKKAIPALGQFNMNLAQNAKEAADNARAYTLGVKQTTSDQVKADNEKLQSIKNRLEKERVLTGKLKGRPGQGKEAVETRKALQTEMNGEKRLELLKKRQLQIEKQIKSSGEKQQALLKQDLVLMQKEINNLERQKQLTDDIARNEKRGRIEPAAGSLTERRQEKLDIRANRAGIIASGAAVAENQGMRAGFAALNEEIKTSDKNLGRFGKAAIRAQGSVSILGTGLSRVMMILGPYMMAFSILSPIFISFGKAVGFGSEESAKLSETLKKVGDQSENLSKRFDKQVQSSKDVSLSFREQNKALIAYNKGQEETITNVIRLAEEFEAFKNQLGFFTSAWEKLKSVVNLDKETLTLTQQTDLIEKSIQAAFDLGDKEKLSIFATGKNALDGAQEYLESLSLVANGEERLRQSSAQLTEARKKELQSETSSMTVLQAMRKKMTMTLVDGKVTRRELTRAEAQYVRGLAEVREAERKRGLASRLFGLDQEKLVEQAKEQAELDANRVRIYSSMESALEGASESIGKFNQSFSKTTKVDDVLSSFKQLRGTLEEFDTLSGGDREKFFKDFNAEDNPFAKLFKDTKKEQAAYEERLQEIIDTLENFRETTIRAASENKRFNAEIKQLNSVFKTGMVDALKIAERQTKIAQNNAKIERVNLQALLVNNGITEETAKRTMLQLSRTKDRVQQEAILADLGMDSLKMDQLKEGLDKVAAKQLEERVARETEVERAAVQTLKLKQEQFNIEKQLTALLITKADQEAKLQRLQQTGAVELDPAKAAELEIDAAKQRMDMAIQEAEIKHNLLMLEKDLIKARLRAVDAELRSRGKTGIDNLSELNDTLDNNALFSGQALNQQIENARDKFRLDLAETVKKAYGESLVDGLKASGAALEQVVKAQEDRRMQIRKEAEAKALDEGRDPTLAGIAAVNAFNTETDAEGNNKREAERDAVATQAFRQTAESLSATLTDLGPEGAAVSSVISGALMMADAYATFGDSANTAADKAQMAGAAIAAISQIMAANSKAEIAEIDRQIEAEKKRDGKSKESVAKIKQMEKQKEAMARKAFDQNKKMQMAQTIIATATGMMRAYQDFDGFTATALATMIGALGAAQLAIISKTQYAGGASSSVEKPSMQKLSVGKRDNKVDVSRGASGGELAFMRGARGVGTNANNFTPTGGAYGMRNYAHTGEGILVGEQGPEVVTPTQPVDVMPANMGGAQNINFTINAVDADGIETVLENQRGNIIGMIRSAANGYGAGFLEEVDTDVISSGGYQKA